MEEIKANKDISETLEIMGKITGMLKNSPEKTKDEIIASCAKVFKLVFPVKFYFNKKDDTREFKSCFERLANCLMTLQNLCGFSDEDWDKFLALIVKLAESLTDDRSENK